MLKELRKILFSNNTCLMCRNKDANYKAYICKDCYPNLEIVDKEMYINSQYIHKSYYSLLYNRYLREQIANYKFNGKSYLHKPFGGIMVDTVKKKEIDKAIDLIIYIPSHRRKEALRGYNQAELLAAYISKTLDKPLSEGNLVKIKLTKEQSGLNRLDRTVNLKDSFRINYPEEIKTKKILLIDDIITTGTTMEECSKILHQHGAKEIIGLALTSSKIQ